MHYSEDDLTLYYYGEARDGASIEDHLERCDACAGIYRSIAVPLDALSDREIPGRGPSYGEHVWQLIASRLPEQERAAWRSWIGWRPAMAAAAILIAGIAFTVGRIWPNRAPTTTPAAVGRGAGAGAPADEADDRVRAAAFADHLDRSERVLLDLMNADPNGQADLSAEREWAADLIDANRLYRDAASRAGDVLVAGVLDDLERTLLDVKHGPSRPSAGELSELRQRLDGDALLFKVRVLAGELREREGRPIHIRKTT